MILINLSLVTQTTLVNACANDMKKWAKKNNYNMPHFCFFNMASVHTALNEKDGVMKLMLRKFAKELEIDKNSELKAYESRLKKKVLVLVLDEIDMFFKKRDGNGEAWFRTLTSWAEDKQLCFSMIGISNSVNDTYSTRIREIGHVSLEVLS